MSSIETGSILHERYIVEKFIAENQFDKIYLVEERQSGENWLVKEIKLQQGDHFSLQQLQKRQHPQIEQLKDFFWQDETLFLVQSYWEGQTYEDLLRYRPLTEEEASNLLPPNQSMVRSFQ